MAQDLHFLMTVNVAFSDETTSGYTGASAATPKADACDLSRNTHAQMETSQTQKWRCHPLQQRCTETCVGPPKAASAWKHLH